MRCPLCQAGNAHHAHAGSEELTCQRCGSLLEVWAAQLIHGANTPHTVAVVVKQRKIRDRSAAAASERYALPLERKLMEYTSERESSARPFAPRNHQRLKRMMAVSILFAALMAGFATAKFALHLVSPANAHAEAVIPDEE